MKRIIFILFLVFTSNIYAADAIPDGWRLPDKEDETNDWARFNAPNKITADFNGDGKIDTAYILLNKKKAKGFMVVANVNEKQFKLEQNDEVEPQSVAIELIDPSNEVWESACEKGYWDCATGEIRQFKITKPSIQFCFIESACKIYMWSDRKRDFISVPISD